MIEIQLDADQDEATTRKSGCGCTYEEVCEPGSSVSDETSRASCPNHPRMLDGEVGLALGLQTVAGGERGRPGSW